MASEAVDDYLKIIFALTQEGGHASTGEIAQNLSLTPASVTGMIKKLSRHEPPLVIYTKSRGVKLTDAGRKRALEIIRHHRLLETFLHDTLSVPWDRVHEEAERLEHYISEDLEDAIAEHLGHPKFDPHGSPIPDRDGAFPDVPSVTLLELDCDRWGQLIRIPGEDPELREYLEDLGLIPGNRVRLDQVEPFGGPVYFTVEGRDRHGISQKLARRLVVLMEG